MRCDVRSFEDVGALASRVEEELGRCDILVNNAGLGAGRAFADLNRERIDQVIQTNVLGVMYCTKAFLPMMLRDATGHIVNVASLAGRHPVPGAAVYSASKHAVAAFSESTYHELRPRGILVTTVNPGFVETPGFPQSDLPRAIVMRPERVARAIVETVRLGKAPQVSVPRWAGAFEFFRVALPGPYRYAAGRVIGARRGGAVPEPPPG